MVVDSPVSSDEKASIQTALEEVSSGSVTIESVQTATDSAYDYEVIFSETQPKPKRRTNTAVVLWHEDQDDWEVNITKTGYWMS